MTEIDLTKLPKLESPPKEIMEKMDEVHSYKNGRNYPFWPDQLEMLYRDIDSGKFGEDAKTGEFFLSIKGVKDGSPKPENLDTLKEELDVLMQAEIDK